MRRLLTGYAVTYNKRHRRQGQDRIKGDERILSDGDFVNGLLSEADDHYNRRYRLRMEGFDFESILQRVATIYNLEREYVMGKGRQKYRVEAKDLVFFRAVNDLGLSKTELAEKFGMSIPGVGYAVTRGEVIANREGYRLIEQ